MLFFPESPRYLMDNGRSEEALQVLADLHGKGDINNELVRLEVRPRGFALVFPGSSNLHSLPNLSQHVEISEAVEFDKTLAARSFLDLLKPDVLRRGQSLSSVSTHITRS